MSIATLCQQVVRLVLRVLRLLWSRLWLRPTLATHLSGTAADLVRSKSDHLIENALLRHQLVVLRRSSKRPLLTPADRTLLVLLAGHLRSWRRALLIIQPDTLLCWHRAGFRLFWKQKSRRGPGRPPLPEATITLIKEMTASDAVVAYSQSMTWKGLHPAVHVVTTAYQTGIRLTKDAMAAVEAQINHLPGLSKWFLDILYQPPLPSDP